MSFSDKQKRAFWSVVRAALGVALAAFIVWNMIHKSAVDLREQFGHANLLLVVAGIVGIGIAIVVTTLRWQMLLHAQGIRLPLPRVLRLTMIGQFFSLAIPGAVGGDLVKMGYIGRHLPGRGAEAIMTIVLDRILGLLGLLILAAICSLIFLPWILAAGQWVRLTTLVVCAGSVAGIVATALAAAHERLEKLPGARHAIDLGRRYLPDGVKDIVARLVKAFDTCRNDRGALVRALGLSLLVHCILAASMIGFAHAPKGVPGPPTARAFLAVQVANGISGIPITPAGIGARDKVFAEFLKQLDMPAQAAVFAAILPTFAYVVWGLVGAVVFVFSRFEPHELDEAATSP